MYLTLTEFTSLHLRNYLLSMCYVPSIAPHSGNVKKVHFSSSQSIKFVREHHPF